MDDANFIKDDKKWVIVYLGKKGIVNETTTEYLGNLFGHSPIFTYITFLDILPQILEQEAKDRVQMRLIWKQLSS